MISLKKHIESNRDELLQSALTSYRAVLEAMGNSGAQVCPPAGSSLRQSLLKLQQHLVGDLTPNLVEETEQQVESELRQWGQDASDYFKLKAAEIKELLIVVAAQRGGGRRSRPAICPPFPRVHHAARVHRRPARPDGGSRIHHPGR